MNNAVLKEAIGVGFLGMIIGSMIGKLLEKVYGVSLPKACNSWNKYYIMEISLFLTNFIIIISATLLFVKILNWYFKPGFLDEVGQF